MTKLHQLAQRYWRITWLLMLAWPAWWALDREPPFRQLAPATYTVTATAGSHGSISPTGASTIASGQTSSFTVTAVV